MRAKALPERVDAPAGLACPSPFPRPTGAGLIQSAVRVFRIRSLDQMLDETDRLFRAHAEGDLIKWVRKDQDAPMKVGLLLKQLEALSRALREIARQQNWVFEEG